DQIVRDVVDMAASRYAVERKLPAAQALEWKAETKVGSADAEGWPSVTVSVALPESPRRFSGRLKLEDHIFDPRVYSALAGDRAYGRDREGKCLSAVPRVSAEDRRLLKALLDLRAEVLVREDKALSQKLQTAPDAEAHEQAALLLGAFALRDEAGRSTDTRIALGRMTSHLAMARALTCPQGVGLTGRVAEAVLSPPLGCHG